MKWYVQAWKKYAVFRGRARRREFWSFVGTYLLATYVIGLYIFLTFVFVEVPESQSSPLLNFIVFLGFAWILYTLATFIPSIALYVRRLHDTGRSGRWVWLNCFVPLGNVVLLILCLQDSELEDNEYGPNPKDVRTHPIVGYHSGSYNAEEDDVTELQARDNPSALPNYPIRNNPLLNPEQTSKVVRQGLHDDKRKGNE